MLNYQEALDYLYSFIDYERHRPERYSPEAFNLGKMRALMAALGNPQDRYPILHVAGTKGKGSTSAVCDAVLSRAGYRSGFYSSPHLQDFRVPFDKTWRSATCGCSHLPCRQLHQPHTCPGR